MNTAYISLGSNIEDRLQHLTEAIHALHSHQQIEVTKVSSIYETAPVGYTDQADFLNLAVCVKTSLNPYELLAACQDIENGLGRVREVRWGPRTVDLDILLYNNDNIEAENLIVPHPRMGERAFVLVPLLEIAPTIEHPVSGTPFSVADENGVVLWKKIEKVGELL
ncbi:2-amino-4-hydroxy-6-hydroxymethyldihydropteridine diphosphokinase [Sporosarcina sp. ACRSL]|uniref:2-amino-4-hydroxy-6- hydroxymethyldihydropteridine diphosphokinase n=1 Tax=Sporosarcina sp. ACRSL TaxID=2918215 RepID=UPI001EF3FA07|nr:2-amino-4-hydroxy-6-hydroxymethyldihydropteridine diphosphokinase [Sporosarcina sp. ACRSL]MCG7346248.1 2-amino-4-hydroxy-6-hydroxymethyldihydropteridine diphosphokinase [Sporosarcina sp. ACRSL]